MADLAPGVAARAHRATEVLHSMIYFVPEADEEFVAAGLRPGRMGYFASRSAPMGAVSAGVTAATFYNFNPMLVARFIPRAWSLAAPPEVLVARLRAAERALCRLLGDAAQSPELTELVELIRPATDGLPVEGRPLFAAHADLEWPEPTVLAMWHAVTLLREFRGDGHIAALLANGLSGIEAIATHTASGRGFNEAAAKQLRGWSDEQWAATLDDLAGRGLMNGSQLTDKGLALREKIEDATDHLDSAPWLALGAARTDRVIELGKKFSRLVVSGGAIPADLFSTRS